MAEDFGGGKLDDMPKELSKTATTLRELRELHGEGKVSMEGEWGYTRDWAPTAYFGKDVWLRAKLDVYVQEDDTSARVIDWKTGRKFGNEYAHASQAMIYAVATFMRFPRLQALAGVELLNGRVAMLGFAAAIAGELLTGKGMVGQLAAMLRWYLG